MLDKIMYTNTNKLTLVFTDRSPVTITSSEGNALELFLWLVTPTKSNLTLPEFTSALAEEDTVTVRIPNAA